MAQLEEYLLSKDEVFQNIKGESESSSKEQESELKELQVTMEEKNGNQLSLFEDSIFKAYRYYLRKIRSTL